MDANWSMFGVSIISLPKLPSSPYPKSSAIIIMMLGKSEELWLSFMHDRKDIEIIKNDNNFSLIIFSNFIFIFIYLIINTG
jgi:hypothetical protein